MQEPQNLFIETPELLAEKRKQEIAAMLLKQLSGGAPQVEKTRILAKQPILGALLNAGGQFLARNDLQRADQRIGEITQGQRQKAQEEYSAASNEMMNAPDKNAAIAKFIASGNPMVRALAQAELKAVREAAEKEAERKRQLAEAAARLYGEKGATQQGLQTLQTQNIDPNLPIAPAPEPQLTFPQSPEGKSVPFTVNTDPKTGKRTGTAGSLGSETRIVLPEAKKEAAAATALGGEVPKVLRETMEGAQKSIQVMDSASRILDTLQDPAVITGAFAEPRLFLAKVGDLLGLAGSKDIGKTQGLMSELANQTLSAVRRLPGAITEKERPFLEMAAAGKLDYSPDALRRLAEIAQVVAHNELMQYVKQYDAAARQPGVGESAGMYPFPKGWRFQPNEKTMEPQGEGSDLWRMRPQSAAPAAPDPTGLTPAEQKRLEELRKRYGR